MKFGLAQINPTIGALKENTQKVLQYIEKAKQRGVTLLLFPELTVTGYPPRDLLDFEGFVDENIQYLQQIQHASQGVAVLCGFVEKNNAGAGCSYHNSVAFLKDGKLQGVYRKRLIPNYDIFDEARYFEAGQEPLILELEGKKFGVSICEDMWNVPGFTHRAYLSQPMERYKGVDTLLNISASPFRRGKALWRIELLKEWVKRLNCSFLMCNQVGGNDELLFDGCSLAMSRGGEIAAVGKAFKEDLIVVDSAQLDHPAKLSVPWPRSESEWVCEALKMGLSDYVHKCGGESVVLGLSGGIDSSVATSLAVEALGKNRVWGFALPTKYNSPSSAEDAAQLAKNLGIEYKEISIQPIFEALEKTWEQSFHQRLKGITRENIQPRIRMTLLMAIANERKSFLLNTSNKSELATGFSTLYGDSAGALSVLGDLTKAQVYELGRYLNSVNSAIPERVFQKAPSAELREGQVDQDALPPYEILDRLVEAMVEQNMPAKQLSERISKQWTPELMRRHLHSEYKRWQHPPVLRVSSRAFGVGRRIPIAATRQD